MSSASSSASTIRATAVGALAILIWSSLAPLAALSGTVPPFQLVACSFALAAALGLGWGVARGRRPADAFRQPPVVWAVGIAGLFGYHFLYFLALQSAPPVEASLINYLWPLLIVVLSATLPGERLAPGHVLGALAGLGGTVLLVTKGQGLAIDGRYVTGYVAALGAAFTWAIYSVLRRRIRGGTEDAVTGFCFVTAILAALCHLAWEQTVWPADPVGWAALLFMGLGPVGSAFFLWDHGVRNGDIRTLGTLSYAAPVLSTLLLIAGGLAVGHWSVWVACAVITGGSLLSSREMVRSPRTR